MCSQVSVGSLAACGDSNRTCGTLTAVTLPVPGVLAPTWPPPAGSVAVTSPDIAIGPESLDVGAAGRPYVTLRTALSAGKTVLLFFHLPAAGNSSKAAVNLSLPYAAELQLEGVTVASSPGQAPTPFATLVPTAGPGLLNLTVLNNGNFALGISAIIHPAAPCFDVSMGSDMGVTASAQSGTNASALQLRVRASSSSCFGGDATASPGSLDQNYPLYVRLYLTPQARSDLARGGWGPGFELPPSNATTAAAAFVPLGTAYFSPNGTDVTWEVGPWPLNELPYSLSFPGQLLPEDVCQQGLLPNQQGGTCLVDLISPRSGAIRRSVLLLGSLPREPLAPQQLLPPPSTPFARPPAPPASPLPQSPPQPIPPAQEQPSPPLPPPPTPRLPLPQVSSPPLPPPNAPYVPVGAVFPPGLQVPSQQLPFGSLSMQLGMFDMSQNSTHISLVFQVRWHNDPQLLSQQPIRSTCTRMGGGYEQPTYVS